MSIDMNFCCFSEHVFGKIALQRFGDVPENFRLYEAGWLGAYPDFHGMEVKGAEFQRLKSDPSRGKKIKGTERTVYISVKDLREFKEEK